MERSTEANQASRQHIVDVLGISDDFGKSLVELAVADYNNGGTGRYRSGDLSISRRARRQLKRFTSDQIEAAIARYVERNENIARAHAYVAVSPFISALEYFRVTIFLHP